MARPSLGLALLVAALAGASPHAMMRIYTNVPFASFPEALKAAKGAHFLDEGFLNVKSPPYNAKGDGAADDSAAFLSAIHDAYENNLVLYVPSGTYLISRQLRLAQGPKGTTKSQRKFAHIVAGEKSAAGRPVLKLKDGTQLPGSFVEFVYEAPGATPGTMETDPSRQYNATFKGLNIDMGNNPGQSALSMSGAQYCVIEDVDISGNFDAGIHQLPGSGGSTTNVKITGGRVGILQDQYRPNPLVTGVTLMGQRAFGVQLVSSRGPLTIVGFHIESPAAAPQTYRAISLKSTSTADTSEANLNLIDGDILVHGGNIPAIDNFDQDVYVRNVYIRSDVLIQSGARQAPAKVLKGTASAYRRISEYWFAGGADNSHVVVDGAEFGHSGADVVKAGMITDDNPPADLISRHIWDEQKFPDFRDKDIVSIVRDYGATPDDDRDDDAPAIQRALDDTARGGGANAGKAVFIPRGHFHIKQPIRVPAGARLFGASNTMSAIEISSAWTPASATAALITDDRADASLTLANFAILGHDPSTSKRLDSHRHLSLLVLRTDRTLLRDVQFAVREYWQQDNAYEEPVIVLTDNAGGRLYNVAWDAPANHTKGTMAPGYRIVAIRGTTHPIYFYEPDTEHMNGGPQMEISGSQHVFLYAYKYQDRNQLLLVQNSSNVGVFGGSGNYSLYGADDTTMIAVVSTTNYVFANIARRPDPNNPRDRAGAAAFSVVTDGGTRVAADRNSLALFKSGEIPKF